MLAALVAYDSARIVSKAARMFRRWMVRCSRSSAGLLRFIRVAIVFSAVSLAIGTRVVRPTVRRRLWSRAARKE